MKQKTFFSIATVIALLMVGIFTVQLLSLPATYCLPEFDFDCEMKAQAECFFDFARALLMHSWCEGDTCMAEWEVYCDKEKGLEFGGFIECSDFFNPYCENN